jgi:transposase
MARDGVWTVEQKRAILEEYALAPWGSKGAVLRRHRISHRVLTRWASHRDRGILEIGDSWERRERMTPRTENAEIVRLRAEVRRLEAERDQAIRDRETAEAAAEILGKASALLQQALRSAEPSSASDPSSPTASPS